LKTRTLLSLVFSLVLAIVIGRSVWSYLAFTEMLQEYNALVQRLDRIDDSIQRVATNATDLETGIRGWLATGERLFLQPYNRATTDREASVDLLLDLERKEGAAQLALAERLRIELEEFEKNTAAPLISTEALHLPEAQRLALLIDGKQKSDAIRGTIGLLRADVVTKRDDQARSLAAYQVELGRDAWGLGAAVMLVLSLIAITTVRAIETPLAQLVVVAEKTALGIRSPAEVSGVYEVRLLGAALARMADRLFEERARERRFTELVVGLSGGGSVDQIAEVALRALVLDQGAAGGVLWVKTSDARVLRLAASLGFDRSLLSDAAGSAGSLAREVLASAKATRIDRLDDGDAFVLRSSLLETAPRSLLAVPIDAAGEQVGVMELAGSLRPTAEDDLVRALARVGLALQNALGLERVALLRDELSAVNERLKSQNEELRKREEELQTRSAELVSKQGELGQRNDELTRASQLKSDFLSNMSHELRTPLNAVIGFADVLLCGTFGPLRDEQRSSISDILSAGRQLLALVNDILDLSKIEAGHLDLTVDIVDLAAPLREAVNLLTPTAQKKNITLSFPVENGAFIVLADHPRLRQIVLNLLANAIKFTANGGSVILAAERTADTVRVTVTDTGVGISPSEVGLLFRPFTQLRNANHVGGTGLGLSISRRLVEMMGGTIGVESELGQGSVFFFTLHSAGRSNIRTLRDSVAPGSIPAPGSPAATADDPYSSGRAV